MNWQKRLSAGDATLHLHLLGIGGSGLSAIAKVLLDQGMQVSGSDRQMNDGLAQLAAAGARIYAQQQAENLLQLPIDQRPDLVLISSAVDANNPERRAAERLGIPLVKRSDFLPALLGQRAVIAVAGTHGKSTTTAMITKMLREAGVEAGYIIGAHLPGYGNAAAGRSPYFVIEADEYDRMFHGLAPVIAVITNVEWDHPDCYPTAQSFEQAFEQFAAKLQTGGVLITCADDAGAEKVGKQAAQTGARWLRYGLNEDADLRACNLHAVAGQGMSATVSFNGQRLGELCLTAPGEHNLRNALAALAVACKCGIDSAQALASLGAYQGSSRRFEIKGEAGGVLVIDDYAHHPTEIRATLAAARQRYPQRRLWAVFQPHTYSRTRTLLAEMAASFDMADSVIVSDIYAAREQNDGTVNAADIVAASSHRQIKHIGSLPAIAEHLLHSVRPGDVVITLGAGDGNRVGERLLEGLRQTA